MVTALLVLTVSTGCTTTSATDEQSTFKETLLSMIPVLPEVPALPQLTWSYQDGLYCLDEQNVDRLLDYGENTLPRFRWELDKYRRELEIVLSSI